MRGGGGIIVASFRRYDFPDLFETSMQAHGFERKRITYFDVIIVSSGDKSEICVRVCV